MPVFSCRKTQRSLGLATALALLAAWLLTWGAASAQSYPPLNGVVADNTGSLNAAQINDAAQALQTLGVKPLAVFSSSMFGASTIDEFANNAAANYGFTGSNGALDPNLFAIVVTTNPRQLELLWCDNLNAVMADPPAGQGAGTKIRTQFVQPQLAAGNYTEAYTSGFQQAATEISQFRIPLTPTPAPTAAPPVVTNIDTSGIGNALLWIAGIVVIGIGLLVLVPLAYRAFRRSQDAAARKRALQEQFTQARATAADMITNLDFPADPNEQIQYRFLKLALENERPDQLSDLTKQYNQMYGRVTDALARYNSLNGNKPSTEEELSAAIAGYQAVQSEINEASGFLGYLADLSKQVEAQTAGAPGEIDQAKKALAAATGSIERLAAAAPDLYHPQADTTLKEASDTLATAQASLQAQPPMPLRAYDMASAASTQAGNIAAAADALAATYAALSALRGKLSALQKQGYKLPGPAGADADIVKLLSDAARSLEKDQLDKSGDSLKQAAGRIDQAGKDADAAVALYASNAAALAHLQSAGEQVKGYIDQGAKAFDQVDEYAESSWQDIRGNGSEAQKAAAQAHDLWQQATALNALTPDSPQDFQQAAGLISQANSQLQSARKLIDAIIDRLKNLQESQRTAQAELTTAAKDIKSGQDFVAQYDRDITPHPADLLKSAAATLAEAQSAAAQTKPDWIDVVAKARSANDLANQALSEARSQHQALEARRLKLNTLLQQAQASMSRAANFASVHRSDVSQDVLGAIDAAGKQLQQGQTIAAGLEGGKLEDAALAAAYDNAANVLALGQMSADQAYNIALSQFNALENLRGNLDNAMRNANARLDEAEIFIREHSTALTNQPAYLLQQAQRALPDVGQTGDAQTINSGIAGADRARDWASQALSEAQSEYRSYQEEEDRRSGGSGAEIGAQVAMGVLGALISSGSRSRSYRGSTWGGGWSGGGGGHSGGGGF